MDSHGCRHHGHGPDSCSEQHALSLYHGGLLGPSDGTSKDYTRHRCLLLAAGLIVISLCQAASPLSLEAGQLPRHPGNTSDSAYQQHSRHGERKPSTATSPMAQTSRLLCGTSAEAAVGTWTTPAGGAVDCVRVLCVRFMGSVVWSAGNKGDGATDGVAAEELLLASEEA